MKLCLTRQALLLATLSLTFCSQSARGQSKNPKNEPAFPSDPKILFRNISPSVFVVESLDENGSVVALGSGVAVRPLFEEFLQHRDSTFIITNSHVIDPGVSVRVRQGNKTWLAQIEHIQLHADLCRLRIDGLKIPGAQLRSSETLAAGEQVYAIGAPEGLELSISGGLIAAIRDLNGEKVIQTTAAISHGSSGGGLFDRDGRLVGITTFTLLGGQNLNFALPVESVLEPVKPQDSDLIHRHVASSLTYDEGAKKFGSEFMSSALAGSQEAEPILEKAPSDWKAHFDLGDILLAWNPHRAVHELTEAIRLKPDDAGARADLGVALSNVGDPYGGVQEPKEAVRLAPDDWSVHVRLLNTLLDDRNAHDSLREFREVARLAPRWPRRDNVWTIAYSMWASGDADSALEACNELMQVQGLESDGHYCRGQILQLGRLTGQDVAGIPVQTISTQDCQGSISELRESIQLKPDEPGYRAALTAVLESCDSSSKNPN